MRERASDIHVEPDEDGARVRLRTDGVAFRVHNPGVMPLEVQHQLFQRVVSTKKAGHGLGTYSMKLLTERYLSGTISFTSVPAEGTAFTVRYPLRPLTPRGAAPRV